MQRVVVAVRLRGTGTETDFEVPTDVGAAELAERLARTVGGPPGSGPLELRALSLGRALRPHETLAEAGLWDGATLVLAHATDPVEADGLTALVAARVPSTIVHVPEPPLLMPPSVETAPRPIVPLVAAAVVILALTAGAVVWFTRGREAPAPSVEPAATPPVAAATVGPTPIVIEPTVAPTVATVQPTVASTQSTNDEDAAYRDLLARLDTVWGLDWPASIALLQTFHIQYPTRTAATDKLYAAFVEYGRALLQAGAAGAAAEAFDQAVRLQPQRFEARDALASLTPAPTPPPEPAAAPTAVPAALPPAPTVALPIVVQATSPPVVAEPPPAPPEPAAASLCDVRSGENACPLADGSNVHETIAMPDGRHFFWFGVPNAGMELNVSASGAACPCTLFLVDQDDTLIASAIGNVDRVMSDVGPYLVEVAPRQDAADPDAEYVLTFALQTPPTPVPFVEEPTPAPPTATPLPAPVSVPPVVGRSTSDAVDHLRLVGLESRVQTADRYSPGGAGTIAQQDPQAGSAVPPDSVVTLLVASGNVAVPPVVGLFEQDAIQTLQYAGFDISVRHLPRQGVEAGRVASVDPPVGAAVPAGTTVNVTISQGS